MVKLLRIDQAAFSFQLNPSDLCFMTCSGVLFSVQSKVGKIVLVQRPINMTFFP